MTFFQPLGGAKSLFNKINKGNSITRLQIIL